MYKEIVDKYKSFDIVASKTKSEDNNGTVIIKWIIYQDGIFKLQSTSSCDGSRLQSEKHALRDAKENIDVLINLGNWTIKR